MDAGLLPDAALEPPVLDRLADALCPILAADLCAARRRCCSSRDAGPSCVEELGDVCAQWVRRTYGAWTADRIDRAQLEHCLAAVRRGAERCRADFEQVCSALLTGEQCGDARVPCVGGECFAGACVAYVADTHSCERAPCNPGSVCSSGRCESADPSLARSALTGACEADSDCLEGVCMQSVCTVPRECDYWSACGTGRRCVGEDRHVCRPNGLARSCGARLCDASQVCAGDRCVPLPEESQPCPQGFCATGLLCYGTDEGEFCRRPARTVGLGERCDDFVLCESGTGCPLGSQPRCIPLADAGGDCSAASCPTGSTCGVEVDHGRCVPGVCALPVGFDL